MVWGSDAGRWAELNARIGKALTTCSKLKKFWYKTSCTIKWKMQVYNAIIIAQLTYGLNTLQMTPAMLKRVDAFQMRGLRYILKMDHSYYSGISNQTVYDKARIVLNNGNDDEVNLSWDEWIGATELGNAKEIRKISSSKQESK